MAVRLDHPGKSKYLLCFGKLLAGNILKSFPRTDGLIHLISGFLQRYLLASSMVLCSLSDQCFSFFLSRPDTHGTSQNFPNGHHVWISQYILFQTFCERTTKGNKNVWVSLKPRRMCSWESCDAFVLACFTPPGCMYDHSASGLGGWNFFSLAGSLNMLSWALYLSDS